MKAVKCACCGGSMKRNGKTSSGAQRWRCAACGASATVRYDDAAARLEEFLSWLLSKGTQLEMPGAGRTFRRRTSEFWEVWPMPVPDGGSTASFSSTGSARGAPGRADLLQRRARRLVVHGGIRELEGVVGAHGADTGSC